MTLTKAGKAQTTDATVGDKGVAIFKVRQQGADYFFPVPTASTQGDNPVDVSPELD